MHTEYFFFDEVFVAGSDGKYPEVRQVNFPVHCGIPYRGYSLHTEPESGALPIET